MSTTTTLTTLTINYLTQAQYDAAVAAGTIDENQLYMTPKSDGGDVPTVTQEATPSMSASSTFTGTTATITATQSGGSWNAGTMFSATVSGDTVIFTNGTAPSYITPTIAFTYQPVGTISTTISGGGHTHGI